MRCFVCERQFEEYDQVRRHMGRVHKVPSPECYIHYQLSGVPPECECGCGARPMWRAASFQRFINGHSSIGKNNSMYGLVQENHPAWKGGTGVCLDCGIELKSYSGKRCQSCKNKGDLNPFYGKKRPEHSKLMKSPEMMKKIFKKRSATDIELIVGGELDGLGISYHSQFFMTTDEGNTYSYDFKIKGKKIIIEVDGDYWHGGPGCVQHVPFLDEVSVRDLEKEQLAISKGYTVIRLWGSDVKSDVRIVRERLSHLI